MEKEDVGDVAVNGMIVLTLMLKEWDTSLWIGFIWLAREPVNTVMNLRKGESFLY
jgi:hypothetical protein